MSSPALSQRLNRNINVKLRFVILTVACLHAGLACGQESPKPATETTRLANEAVNTQLPFDNREDFELASHGFIASIEEPVMGANGRTVWDPSQHTFVEDDTPPSANPSLWRQAQLNNIHGLFEVVEGIYQVRGYDISNTTFIRGETGWVVIDALRTQDAMEAAKQLVFEHLGERPIAAVIITHSHGDHFGGIRALTGDPDSGGEIIPVLVPSGFLDEVGAEGVIAGSAMVRRLMYQFGFRVPENIHGRIDGGLGKDLSMGALTLVPPTIEIETTGQRKVIDGIELVFQMTPGAEAPVEMMVYLPQFKALSVAEMANATMHNLYTLRGATVRDGLKWSKHLNDAIELFGNDLELIFGSHHWPRLGKATAIEFLSKQRDLYRFMHDQTVRLMSNGLTPTEIAEQLELPPSLGQEFYNRGYYGTLSHNAKAVYQHYLGWFDGVPANLNPLPPAQAGERYVRLAGGADALLEQARESFDDGDYRWVAEVVNRLVFAEPDNSDARRLLADAYEQLGYQAESATWRNFYLAGVQELRAEEVAQTRATFVNPALLPALPTGLFLDYLAVRLDPAGIDDRKLVLNLDIADRGERFVLFLENSVLHNSVGRQAESPDATLRMDRSALEAWLSGQSTIDQLIGNGAIEITGDHSAVTDLFSYLKPFDRSFNIVVP